MIVLCLPQCGADNRAGCPKMLSAAAVSDDNAALAVATAMLECERPKFQTLYPLQRRRAFARCMATIWTFSAHFVSKHLLGHSEDARSSHGLQLLAGVAKVDVGELKGLVTCSCAISSKQPNVCRDGFLF